MCICCYRGDAVNSCELISAITALAAALAVGKTPGEISFLGVVFTQLGDTLATIAAQRELCEPERSE